MKVSDYIVKTLIEYGVTDTFGIPGGVILRLLEAMDNAEDIESHLNYHEQMAGFAACGYAQASGRLGVAYATRGPGITNMITSIAEAYQESLPVLFITAHGCRTANRMRFENSQELDVVSMVSGITKYAVNIESIDEVTTEVRKACKLAITGRKGPVLVDVEAALWMKDMPDGEIELLDNAVEDEEVLDDVARTIKDALKNAERPVILIGDGVRHSASKETLYDLAEKIKIPILSSRGSQDIISGATNYFGYIGSHGIRYSNFILSKADLIITLGNRLAFPIHSESFSPIIKKAKLIRIDIDAEEFNRKIPRATTYRINSKDLITYLARTQIKINEFKSWLEICKKIKDELINDDVNDVVNELKQYISNISSKLFVCDVGNNEFWFSRAFERAGMRGTVLCSKSYGTLGVAIGKAIGVYYATREPVTCVIGDQGFQYNMQELQYLAKWKLPITVLVINNRASGMIAEHEKKMLDGKSIHVYEESGYQPPRLKDIAYAYGIDYADDSDVVVSGGKKPFIYEIEMERDIELVPNLPKGNSCQDMEPLLDRNRFAIINNL